MTTLSNSIGSFGNPFAIFVHSFCYIRLSLLYQADNSAFCHNFSGFISCSSKEVLCTSAIRMQLQLHADSDVFPDICHKSRRHIQSCGILHQKHSSMIKVRLLRLLYDCRLVPESRMRPAVSHLYFYQ